MNIPEVACAAALSNKVRPSVLLSLVWAEYDAEQKVLGRPLPEGCLQLPPDVTRESALAAFGEVAKELRTLFESEGGWAGALAAYTLRHRTRSSSERVLDFFRGFEALAAVDSRGVH